MAQFDIPHWRQPHVVIIVAENIVGGIFRVLVPLGGVADRKTSKLYGPRACLSDYLVFNENPE